jgi:hypothetical protein
MREFLKHRSRRSSHDGWALMERATRYPLSWSVCTTREECRALKLERADLADDLEVVKVWLKVEVVR